MNNIYVDGMGGDNAPSEIVKACVDATRDFERKIHILGDEEAIQRELAKYEYDKNLIEIIHTTEIVENEDEPAMVIRRKKDSSMVVGIKKLKEDPRGVFISAGSTGALLAGGTLLLGRIKGIQRPALTIVLPSEKGPTVLLDVGANADCKASYLVQFGMMASVYAQNVLDIKSPKVGLVNIGSEPNKGNELYKETYSLLEQSGLDFIGNVESRDIIGSGADVLVCDGFTGNIILKLTEGLSSFIFASLKSTIMGSMRTKVGGLLLKPALKEFKTKFDYKEYGGAPLLGVRGGVIKAHGSSDARAFYNAIRQGIIFQEKDTLEQISNKLVETK